MEEKNRNEEYYERVNLLLDAMIKAVREATEDAEKQEKQSV